LDEDSLMYHDSLLEPVVGLLIPDAILTNETWSGLDKTRLSGRIGRAVAGEGATKDPTPGYDWDSAARRVDLVLSEHGLSVADINKTFRRFDSLGEFVPVEDE
jgi:hypothetical protein